MNTSISRWCAVALVSFASLAAQAQDFKVGVVNVVRLTNESAPAKSAQQKLEQEFAKRQKELADQQANLKSFSEKFERDAPTLSETQRSTRQREYADMGRDFQRRQREFQEDLNARRNEELQQVMERANKAVKQVAEAEKFDLVLQEAVYVNSKYDITDKVLKILNSATK